MTLIRFRHQPHQRSFNNLMDDFFINQPSILKADAEKTKLVNSKQAIPVNIKKTATAYLVEVFAPGFQKEDFKIQLDQKTLTISVNKSNESTDEDETYLKREFSFKQFERSFKLGDIINTDNIDAKYVNGVLTLNLPLKQEVKASAKNISVE